MLISIVSSAAIIRLDQVLRDLRGKLVTGSLEEFSVIAPDGRLLAHRIGANDQVITGDISSKTLHGSITVHQHSGLPAFPPSENDLVNALSAGERFHLVVARDGIHRLRIRQPARSARYEALLSSAETLEARAATRVGWHGGKTVPRPLFAKLPAAVGAEIATLAKAYPDFLSYRRFSLDTGATTLLA